MEQTSIDALKSVFSSLWTLLGSITIPGTFLTGQHILVAPLGAVALITVFKKFLDIGGASAGHTWRVGLRSGSSHEKEED